MRIAAAARRTWLPAHVGKGLAPLSLFHFQRQENPTMKLGLQDRLGRIETAARTLARSGRYLRSDPIEKVLLSQDTNLQLEIRKLFSNKWTRSEIDRLCDRAIGNCYLKAD
jgi:hypothetical protein